VKLNKVLHLERNDPTHLYRLEANQMESSSSEKTLGPSGHQDDHKPAMCPFSKEGPALPECKER